MQMDYEGYGVGDDFSCVGTTSFEYTKYVIPEVCRILSMKPKTEENKAHAGELGEMLKKGMTFQMPEDSEVEV